MNLRRLIKPATIDSEEQLKLLRYPLIAMPKYDGIRCALYKGRVLSNTLKPIPNRFIVNELRPHAMGHDLFDGELILTDTKDYNKVQSAVMSRDSRPHNFTFVCFDRLLDINSKMPYETRLSWVSSYVSKVIVLPHFRRAQSVKVYSYEDVLLFETLCLTDGYEGIILRSPSGVYKQGRSTFKEGILFKFKRTEDAEAEILDCIELEHNLNEAETDARGLTKRSSHKDNKIGSGMLGSFKVRGINGKYKDKIFYVSAGSMTIREREHLWLEAKDYIGEIITYKFDKTRGTEDAPASPRFKAFRQEGE